MVIARDRGFQSENTDDRRAERLKSAPPMSPERAERLRDPARPRHDRQSSEKEPKTASIHDMIRRHPMATAAVVVAVILVVIGGIAWWLHARHFELTDDAFIDARIATISSQQDCVVRLGV